MSVKNLDSLDGNVHAYILKLNSIEEMKYGEVLQDFKVSEVMLILNLLFVYSKIKNTLAIMSMISVMIWSICCLYVLAES